MQVEGEPAGSSREQRKLCKILRACTRIIHFRDHRSGLLAGVFAIKEADSKMLEAKKHVHCEMKLVHEYICGNIGPVFNYIGCTKLPCLRCWYTINKGSIFTTGDETHWKIYVWGSLMSEPPAPPALSRLEETNLELDEWLQDKMKDTSSAEEPLQPESPVGW
ncbi:hypothetical protein B0T11DRAFT_294919 [Plectosphaerella cucumerina]|uniref:Uncharacterized protein n=1 Tax=Plectosphaerella cucumerina TaxID=40658 RepID=A0A8K0TPR6_9PEZI|nr:hypothetical protein B0T11DRAFT_294919 [Plectosphaerella cucumerina]